MKPLVIYGAGGFAREVLALVRDINSHRAEWDVRGFLSDDATKWGQVLNGVPILGDDSWLESAPQSVSVALGVGSPAVKRKLTEKLKRRTVDWPTLLHPTVVASTNVELGKGVIITAGNILTTNIELGDFVMVNLACTIGHDCVLGAYSSVSPGANISGNVRLGDGCDIGTGSAMIQGVEVGDWSVIGAGAVVAKSLPANCTAVGVPARVIKERPAGWQCE